MPVKLWFEKLKPEMILFLSQKLFDRTPAEEIVELFHIRFPKTQSIQFTPKELVFWATENIPGWSPKLAEGTEDISLEEEVKKETEGIITDTNFLNIEDQKKINSVQKHRRILLENWENYIRLKKGESPNENAKKSYLDGVRDELKILTELESKEKSLLSIFEEVKAAEEKETPQQFRDYIEGYCLQKIANKLVEIPKIKKELTILKNNIDLFIKTLEESPNLDEGIRNFLKKIYTVPIT